jgi:methionine sulfoxide reductase heme-binding subunit
MTATLTSALWYLGRGTGIVALLMFTLTLVLGMVTRSGRRAMGVPRFGIVDLHRTAALSGAGLVAVHVASLLLDPFAQLRLVDLFIPFHAGYRPLWVGLGALALDTLVVIVSSSLFRHRIGPGLFRTLHWLTYALWPLAFIHALGSGTDAATWWLRGAAAVCALAVTVAVGWRISDGFHGRPQLDRKATAG